MSQAQIQAPSPRGETRANYKRILVQIPVEWLEKMRERMAKTGCYSYGEYVRRLIARDLGIEKEADQ